MSHSQKQTITKGVGYQLQIPGQLAINQILQTKHAQRDSATPLRPAKRNRHRVSGSYGVRRATDEVTSDDPLGSSFGGQRVQLGKSRTNIGPNITRPYFESSSQAPAYSSSPACQDRVRPQPHAHEDWNYESDEESTGSTQYLWGKAPRRTAAHSTSEHEPVVAITRSYLKAWIISGHAGPESTPWPDTNKQWLSDRMGEAWRKMSRLLGNIPGCKRPGVNDKPTEAEARKFYDSFGQFRGHCMASVRTLVSSGYDWQLQSTREDRKEYAGNLLRDDNFACDEPPKARFCAKIISRALSTTVFSKCNRWTFELHTKHFFDPLPVNPVLFVVTMIAHCIREYETGEYSQEQFDGPRMSATWRRVKNTWFEQSKDRQEVILSILLRRVIQQIGKEQIGAATDTEAVNNPYANTLDDLPIDKTDDMSTLNTSNSGTIPWQLPSSAARLVDKLDSSDTESHKELNKTITNNIDERLIDPELLRSRESSSTDSELSSLPASPGRLLKENNYKLIIKIKGGKRQSTKRLDANWGWSWDTFAGKAGLGEGTNARLWYGRDIILDDDDNYQKFMNTYKGQSTITVAYEQGEIQEEVTTQ